MLGIVRITHVRLAEEATQRTLPQREWTWVNVGRWKRSRHQTNPQVVP